MLVANAVAVVQLLPKKPLLTISKAVLLKLAGQMGMIIFFGAQGHSALQWGRDI